LYVPAFSLVPCSMDIARLAVNKAARAARFVAETTNLNEGTIGKLDASPVTVADFAVQALICHFITQAFPNDPIIAEEDADELRKNKDLRERVLQAVRVVEPSATGEQVCDWIDRGTERGYTDRFWTLDPIDGTKGFLRREQYAICLALVESGTPTVGAMACPNLTLNLESDSNDCPKGTLFWAHRGAGAWQMLLTEDDISDENQTYLKATRLQLKDNHNNTDELRFCESVEAAHSNHSLSNCIASALNISRPPIRLDSQAKYGVIARGDADIYLRLPHFCTSSSKAKENIYRENIWDHGAGYVLVLEAGGVVTDMEGHPLDFSLGAKLLNNKGVVASSGPILHQNLLAAIAKTMQ